MNIFAPNYYVQSFKTLNIQKLHEMGIQLLLCDIDNTLVAYDEASSSFKYISIFV